MKISNKKRKISLQNELKPIFKKGTQRTNKMYKLFVKLNNLEYSRFAIVINKKFGNAIMRNKAKRQVRAIFRDNIDKIPFFADIIIFIKNEFKQTVYKDKEDAFLFLLSRKPLK